MPEYAHFSLHGIILEVPIRLLTPEITYALENGFYEGSEIAALRQIVRLGDRVLERAAASASYPLLFLRRYLPLQLRNFQ